MQATSMNSAGFHQKDQPRLGWWEMRLGMVQIRRWFNSGASYACGAQASDICADLSCIRACLLAVIQALLVVAAQQRRLAVVPGQRQHIQRVEVTARPIVGDGVFFTRSLTGDFVYQLRQVAVRPGGADKQSRQ